ncbi:MAG: VOC family protein [Ilumatobacteraceae bacterium]
MALGHPVQIAYSVPSSTDLRSAADDFRRSTGAGPFLVLEHIELESVTIGGVPASFDHSSAYGQWGPFMVELVQEHTEPLIGDGIHHVAFTVESLEAAVRSCRTSGWPLILDATTVGGQRFVFCDARADLGHLIELYEPTPTLTAFYERVRSLAVDCS